MATRTEVLRWSVTGALLAAAYMTATCPCAEPLLSCHRVEFYTLVVAPLAAIAANMELLDGALG